MPKDMNGVELQVGDRVTWSSQAAGSWTEKTGTVVYAGEPLQYRPLDRLPEAVAAEVLAGIPMFDTVASGVVVRVEAKTRRGKARFYAPRLTKLRTVDDFGA